MKLTPSLKLLRTGRRDSLRSTFLMNITSFKKLARPAVAVKQRRLVPKVGLEPTQYCYRGILSPVRLPISPLRHIRFQSRLKATRKEDYVKTSEACKYHFLYYFYSDGTIAILKMGR